MLRKTLPHRTEELVQAGACVSRTCQHRCLEHASASEKRERLSFQSQVREPFRAAAWDYDQRV